MEFIEKLEGVKGTAGIYFKNLKTGREMTYNSCMEFHPASIIKLPIFMAICKMVEERRASFDEKIKVTFDKRVPSCGAFNAFTDEPTVDISTLCKLMITISDNTAANLLISHFSIDRLNQEFRSMGLRKTRIERLFYDEEMQKRGCNNKAVPKELGMLLEKLYKGTFVSKEVSEQVVSVLLEQQCRSKIPAYIEAFCLVGNKTGEADGITGDAALILGENPFVLVVILNETSVPQADEFIRHLSRDMFKEIGNGRL